MGAGCSCAGCLGCHGGTRENSQAYLPSNRCLPGGMFRYATIAFAGLVVLAQLSFVTYRHGLRVPRLGEYSEYPM